MIAAVGAAALFTLVVPCAWRSRIPRASGSLPQACYVWQRSWGDDVRAAVRHAAENLAGFVVLTAEVGWERGKPRVSRVDVDYACLREAAAPVG